jgi:hypothetical protein
MKLGDSNAAGTGRYMLNGTVSKVIDDYFAYPFDLSRMNLGGVEISQKGTKTDTLPTNQRNMLRCIYQRGYGHLSFRIMDSRGHPVYVPVYLVKCQDGSQKLQDLLLQLSVKEQDRWLPIAECPSHASPTGQSNHSNNQHQHHSYHRNQQIHSSDPKSRCPNLQFNMTEADDMKDAEKHFTFQKTPTDSKCSRHSYGFCNEPWRPLLLSNSASIPNLNLKSKDPTRWSSPSSADFEAS